MADSNQVPSLSAGGDSMYPILSEDGRYVLFSSYANNVAAINETNFVPTLGPSYMNVFLRDRITGTTILVSADLVGSGAGDGDSRSAGISANGRYALFESGASNLVVGDTNGVADIFIRDTVNASTVLVSVSRFGTAANGESHNAVMTPDGRFVAFASQATNLVANDATRAWDIYVRDFQSQTTTWISAGSVNGNSDYPIITPDGRHVVYYSTAKGLGAGNAQGSQIYMRDLLVGTNIWVSNGAADIRLEEGECYAPQVSTNGEYVIYRTSYPFPSIYGNDGKIIRYQRSTDETLLLAGSLVPINTPFFETIKGLSMTPDGKRVAWVSTDTLVPKTAQVVVWNEESGFPILASSNLTNTDSIGVCKTPMLTADGRYVVFLSNARDLVPNTLNGEYHLFVRDLKNQTTRLLGADRGGIGQPVSLAANPVLASGAPWVAFETEVDGLVPGDRNHFMDVVVENITAGSPELVSVRGQALPSVSPNGEVTFSSFGVSSNGNLVVFSSEFSIR